MASPPSPRLSALLRYPAQSGLLGVLAICALLRLLSFYLESPIWVQWLPDLQVGGDSGRVFTVVLGLLIDLGVWMLGLKFAIEALLDTAHDRATTAGHGWHVATDRQAIGQILLALVLFLPAYLLMLFEHPGLDPSGECRVGHPGGHCHRPVDQRMMSSGQFGQNAVGLRRFHGLPLPA